MSHYRRCFAPEGNHRTCSDEPQCLVWSLGLGTKSGKTKRTCSIRAGLAVAWTPKVDVVCWTWQWWGGGVVSCMEQPRFRAGTRKEGTKMLEFWNHGVLEPWNSTVVEVWNPEFWPLATLDFCYFGWKLKALNKNWTLEPCEIIELTLCYGSPFVPTRNFQRYIESIYCVLHGFCMAVGISLLMRQIKTLENLEPRCLEPWMSLHC